MDATLWRFLRLRPENFPHIRLAQLAYLYQKGDKLFSRLLEAETLADVRTLERSPIVFSFCEDGRPKIGRAHV